ncbi:MAG: helix-turn-helix domain-containing protein [Bdellovibrionales bacterium]
MVNPLLAQTLGNYFRTRRKELGITQKQLKDKLGFSAQFLGHIESGKAMIPEAAFTVIIKELNLDPNELTRIYSDASRKYVEKLFSLSNDSAAPSQNHSASSF